MRGNLGKTQKRMSTGGRGVLSQRTQKTLINGVLKRFRAEAREERAKTHEECLTTESRGHKGLLGRGSHPHRV